jgi:hypothetical protein
MEEIGIPLTMITPPTIFVMDLLAAMSIALVTHLITFFFFLYIMQHMFIIPGIYAIVFSISLDTLLCSHSGFNQLRI